MKEKVSTLVEESIKELNLFVADAFIEEVAERKVFNIILDSEEIIDLNKITEASRIINKIIDEQEEIVTSIDELDIYSKEKGDENDGRERI